MNEFTTRLIATGRIEDQLREADRARLAALVARPPAAARAALGGRSLWARLRGLAAARPVESESPRPVARPSSVSRP